MKNIYSFLYNLNNIISDIKIGKELHVENMRNDLKTLLEKYKENSNYNQTFRLPTIWEKGKRTIDPDYLPLFTNLNNDIVSYAVKRNNSMIFILPQIKEKHNFLLEFLTNVAPDLIPEIFPFSTQFSWKNKKDYWIPNHSVLIEEKVCIEKELNEKIKGKELEIEKNLEKYSFLHDLIIETGDNLVVAVQKYFRWLGYKNVRIMDNEESESEIKEEDIQIDFDDGLLVIEVKGIGGTSTDSECSQISKIKHRRCKEKNNFDVYAMYLVNHQRYLPPLSRMNHPFTDNQVKDATNDERGLLTTWQLFNLYFDIEKGIIKKEGVKKKLLNYGLIEFKPENLVLVDEPKEFFKNNQVCIVNLKDIKVKVNEELIVERNGRFDKVIIKEIMLDDNPIDEIDNGEIGIKLDKKIMKKSKIWKRSQS